MTFNMPSHKNQFNRSWSLGASKSNLLDASNVGRKLLEKMGWENGLGLGKDNQGMVENPLWKQRRDTFSKTGLKCKDEEVANEILPHQNAFDNLLDELNSQAGEECVNIDMALQIKAREKAQTSKRCVRYGKMARAKDISNYSIKDFEGIIGKEVTKKNLNMLNDNADKKPSKKETSDSSVTQMSQSSSECKHHDTYNLEPFQLCESRRKKKTSLESNILTSNVKDQHVQILESENPERKQKRRHSKTDFTECPDAFVHCSSESVASTSVECTYNESKEVADIVCVDVQCTKVTVRKKNRNLLKENSENSNLFCSDDHTLQSAEISVEKKKKKKKKKKDDICYTYNLDDSSGTSIGMKPATSEYLCNTTSARQIRERDTTSEVVGASKNIAAMFDTSIRVSDKSCNLNEMKTKEDELLDKSFKPSDCETLNDKEEGNYTSTFMPRNNQFFFTCQEREKMKRHIAENPEVLQEISDAFVGSNLISIKGYGNW